MRFSVPPSSYLFVKVFVRKSPYGRKPIALRMLANFYSEGITERNALAMRELPLTATSDEVWAVLHSLRDEFNAIAAIPGFSKEAMNREKYAKLL